MKQNALYILILIAGLLSLNSCSNDINNTTLIVDIQDEIRINLLQDLTVENGYIWNISTVIPTYCKESILNTNLVFTESGQQLVINGIKPATDCSFHNTNLVSNESFILVNNDFNLDILMAKNIENNLEVSKRNGIITLEEKGLTGIILSNTELQTISPRHLWGTLFSNSFEDHALFFSLYEQITENLTYKAVEKGNYGYFKKDEVTTVIDPNSLAESNISFAIESTQEIIWPESHIAQIVLDFRMAHPELRFIVMTGSGNEL